MAYRKEVETALNASLKDNVWGHKVTILGDVVIVEGHKGLLAYDGETVQLRVGKKILTLRGTAFEIVSSADGELIVKGKLSAVEVTE